MTPELSAAIARIRAALDSPSDEQMWGKWYPIGRGDARTLLSALEEAQAVRAALNRRVHDAAYMLEAYRSMLGPIGLKVVKRWDEDGVSRVHHSWEPAALSLTGEERAQIILDIDEAAKTAVPVTDIDSVLTPTGAQP